MRPSAVLLTLMAASFSDAYVQLVIRDANPKHNSLLDGFKVALPANPVVPSNKDREFLAVRDSNPLDVSEVDFWRATWNVYHNEGASDGLCKTFPCKQESTGCGPWGCHSKKKKKNHNFHGELDWTLYNMHKSNTMQKDNPKANARSLDFLKHMYYLGHAATDSSKGKNFLGMFKPNDVLGLGSKLKKMAGKDRPFMWRYVTFNNWRTMMDKADKNRLGENEFTMDLDTTTPKTLYVCYLDPTQSGPLNPKGVPWHQVNNVPFTFWDKPAYTEKGWICDPVVVTVRVLYPTIGNFAAMQNQEKTRQLYHQSTSTGRRIHEAEIDEAISNLQVSEDEMRREDWELEEMEERQREDPQWREKGKQVMFVDSEDQEEVMRTNPRPGRKIPPIREPVDEEDEGDFAPPFKQKSTHMKGLNWDDKLVDDVDRCTIGADGKGQKGRKC